MILDGQCIQTLHISWIETMIGIQNKFNNYGGGSGIQDQIPDDRLTNQQPVHSYHINIFV